MITLIIKHRGSGEQFEDIKRALLANSTTDLLIGLDGNESAQYFNGSLMQKFVEGKDYIVFTYD